jgi:hypothetical protein
MLCRRRLLTPEAQVLSESILCDKYGGQSDNGTRFSLFIMSPVLHAHFHSSASDARIWTLLLTVPLNNTLIGIRTNMSRRAGCVGVIER